MNDYIFNNSSVEIDSTVKYNANNDISVIVKREKCNENKYSAEVFLNGNSYNLCGSYLDFLSNPFIPEAARGLYNIWVIKSINAEALPVQVMVEINLNSETLLAYTSELEISSDIKIQGDKIMLYNLKYISGDSTYFNELNEIDGAEFAYEVKGLNLILKYENQMTIVLGKTD